MPSLPILMNVPLFLAARDDTGEIIRMLFGAIFVAIWIIGALLSSTKKKKKQPGQREKSWEEILEDLAGGHSQKPPTPQQPQPVPPPLPRQAPPARPTQSAPAPQRKKAPAAPPKKVVRKKAPLTLSQQPVVASTVIETSAISQMQSPADILTTEIGRVGDPGRHRHICPRAVTAAQFLTPRSLANQFIITEILQPPLALRDREI